MSIYFYSPDYSFPSGGVRVIYRHVDILNKNGIPAYVLHEKPGFRCEWFKNETRVAWQENGTFQRRLYFKLRELRQPERSREWHISGGDSAVLGDGDYLVLPELLGPRMADMAPGVKKVILNQNCYLMFQGYFNFDKTALKSPYRSEDLAAVLINSEDGLQYHKHVFPDIVPQRFHLSIDPNLFSYQEEKKKQICFSPRKNEFLVRQLINVLKFRGALNDFELVSYSGIPQEQVADMLKESAVFLSFGYFEGFGLPPAEAMACGCITVGFHAEGGREFMKPDISFPIETGDMLGYAKTVEKILSTYDSDRAHYDTMRRNAAKFIQDNYSPAREEEDIVRIWRDILEKN